MTNPRRLASTLLVAAVVCAAAGWWAHRTVRGALRNGTANNLRSVQEAVGMFHQKRGRYPTTNEGLRALIELDLLSDLPNDYWGSRIQYRLEDGIPVVTSLGRDRAPGGEGDARDVSLRGPPAPRAPPR